MMSRHQICAEAEKALASAPFIVPAEFARRLEVRTAMVVIALAQDGRFKRIAGEGSWNWTLDICMPKPKALPTPTPLPLVVHVPTAADYPSPTPVLIGWLLTHPGEHSLTAIAVARGIGVPTVYQSAQRYRHWLSIRKDGRATLVRLASPRPSQQGALQADRGRLDAQVPTPQRRDDHRLDAKAYACAAPFRGKSRVLPEGGPEGPPAG